MSNGTPEWLLVMRSISGMTETPGDADNAKIMAMRDEIARRYPGMAPYCATYQHDSIPWCGLTVAYCMAMCDIRPVFGPTDTDRFLWAQAWDDPSFGSIINSPRLGCVVVMKRSGGGHVTLYERTEGSNYVCRGGNQSDAVNAQSFPISNVIALVWPQEAGALPPTARRTLAEGDKGTDVASVQKSLGIPADGNFGPVTEVGVKFKRPLGQGGRHCRPDEWDELDRLDARMAAGSDDLAPSLIEAIMAAADDSSLMKHVWQDRGRAPEGYIKGMALAFGVAVAELNAGNAAAIEAAKAQSPDAETDALAWYSTQFDAAGMDNSQDGVVTLRHLFVLLIGLGMRESSGLYYCGRDTTAANVTAETAESGLFQTSWNIKSASPHIGDLFAAYWADPNGWLPVFSEELNPTAAGLQNFGSGEGAAYQWLAKYSPTFAALVTALGLRKRRKHWGPISRKECELATDANELLLKVQKLVEGTMPEPQPEPAGEKPIVTITVDPPGSAMVRIVGESA
jgi:uncharacterized protein (TIGR02594 family)